MIQRLKVSHVCLLFIAACTEVANPAYCDKNSDCKNGKVCNLDTHGCELTVAVDAPLSDGPEMDGPFVARTIQEVRAPSTPVDASVALMDVVVTAIDRSSASGHIWVQEQGGGPNSGVHVYSMVVGDLATLDVGDVVDIGNARKITFAVPGDISGRSEIEVTPTVGGTLVVAKKGIGVAASTDLDLASIALLSPPQQVVELEKWAGMLMRITQVRASDDVYMVGAVQQFPIGPIQVNNTQTEFPGGIVNGTCFNEIVGVIEYYRAYNLVPRHETDISLGGACP
ncbi:MAG: hypothetical protein ACKV2T_41415 [Kofleriaceae bacterium]